MIIDEKLELKVVEIIEIKSLIAESMNAFLPSASNPDQKTNDLLVEMRDDNKFKVFAYFIDSKPVAYIVALSNKSPDILSIGPMYVAEKYRGMGLGKRQVMDFVKYAKKSGYEYVFTKTWSKNLASKTIFNDLGFVFDGEKLNDRANGDSTIRYLLKI